MFTPTYFLCSSLEVLKIKVGVTYANIYRQPTALSWSLRPNEDRIVEPEIPIATGAHRLKEKDNNQNCGSKIVVAKILALNRTLVLGFKSTD